MAFFTQNKFNYTTGVPDGNDVYPSVSSTWGDDGAGVLGNGTIAFPTAAGGAGQVLTDVGGTGVLTFADAPSTSPSGSDTQVQYNNGGSFGGMAALTYNDSTGKIIANANASATGDFEILAETTGTAFKVDVSSGLVTSRKDVTIGEDVLEDRTLTIQTGGSRDAILSLTTGIAAGGRNAYTKYVDFGSTIWSVGKQESVSDSFVWSNGSLGTDTRMDLSTSGHLGLFGDLSVNGGAITLNESGPGNNVILSLHSATASSFNTIDQVSDFEGAFHNLKGMHTSGSGKDAGIRLFLGGTELASIGLDGSDSNAFVISRGFIGTDNFARFDTATGAIKFNASASATGDFEVLAETTGTALLVDVSTGDVGIGTTTVNRGDFGARALTLLGTTAGGGLIEIAKDTGDSDGAGIGGLEFNHSLASGNNGRVGLIGCNLSGSTAGNRGSKIAIRTKANGSSTYNINFTIDHDRTFDFAGGGVFNSARIDQNFDFKKTSSGTAFFIDTATTDVGIGTDTPNIAGFGRVLTIVEAADTNNARIELHKNTSDSDGAGLGSYEWTHALVSGANSRVAFVSTRLSGGTAGNRGGELDFGTKANGSSTLSTHLTIDNTGKTVLNAAALSGGDFEVLAETTGTALFVDVSEKKFAIGTGAATNPLTVVSDANGVPILANAKGTSTTSIFLAADYLHTTTANMADNFGTGFRFQIEDVAGVVNDIASVYARRDGADNEGKLELLAGTDGAEVGLTLNSDLVIDIAQNFSQITAITDSGAVNSFERTTTDTSLIRPTFRMLSETSGNMADGFGTGMFFMIKDGGATEIISAIYAIRDGADNEGKLSFRTGVDGDVENAVLDAAGTFTLEQGVVSLKETTTPTSVADYGRIYFKSDNKAYAQTGDGVEHEIAFV